MTNRIGIAAAVLAALTTPLVAAPAHAMEYRDPDHRACVSRSEWKALGMFNNVRRRVVEERFEVKALDVDANDYLDPDNRHLYPVAYKVCGYDPEAEQVLIINYRKTSDAWSWAFKLNRVIPLPAPHGRP